MDNYTPKSSVYRCPWSHIPLARECGSVECKRCGWNPEVHEQRVKKIRELEENGDLRKWGKCGSDFKSRLNKLCNESGVSVKTLAELCGLSHDMIRMYLAGTYTPRLQSVVKVADYFGVSVDYLLGRE